MTGVSPASGPAAGGTVVTISGSNFTGATAVTFGSTAATGVTVDSATQIHATAPAGSGAVDVTVTTHGGTSATSAADRYTYVAPLPPPPPPPPPPITGPPKLVAAAPNSIGTTSATFSAAINPDGLPSTMHFEYGTIPGSYGSTTPEQPVGSDFSSHTVTAAVPGLLSNSTYHFRAIATNAGGRTPGADQAFRTAADPPPPPPVLARSVNIAPLRGMVLIKLSGQGFVPLTDARQIPVGAVLDATNGRVRLTTATTSRGQLQFGDFSGGIFSIAQQHGGLTTLNLIDTHTARQVCVSAGKAQIARRRLSSKVLGLLNASAHGKFTTRAQYSAATVRGTVWTVTNRCDGTLTKVTSGLVSVRDFRIGRTLTVRAGRSYLAKAPGA